MDSGTSFSSMESTTTETRSCRRRPLHTCKASISAMSHVAYVKLRNFDGPIGSVTKKMASLAATACPFLYAIQCHCLALLSFLDDSILAIENKVETIFPPSTYVFNKVDELLLHIAETLPGRFDDAAEKLPLIVRRVPLLEWVLAYVVSWLNFFLSVLVDLGPDHDAAREKEIMVDKKCNETTESSGNGDDVMTSPPVERLTCAYKEALEKGTEAENELRKDDSDEEIVKTMEMEMEKKEIGEKTMDSMVIEEEAEKYVSEDGEIINKDDPILELFESGWHTNSGIGIGALSPSQSQSNLYE